MNEQQPTLQPQILTRQFQAAIDRYRREHPVSAPVARYATGSKSCNWITLKTKSAGGDSTGGAKVCIGDNGKITKGPAALKGKKLSAISGPKNAVDDSIRTGAKRFGVRKDDLKTAVDEVMAERMQVAKEQQELKRIAHKRAGIYPSDVEKLINRNLDWTSVKGFDQAAQELPMLDPRFNWPEEDGPERLWEFLREEAVVLPKKTDEDVIAEAGERLRNSGTTRGKKRAENPPQEDGDADYVPFSRFRQDFERELYRRGVIRHQKPRPKTLVELFQEAMDRFTRNKAEAERVTRAVVQKEASGQMTFQEMKNRTSIIDGCAFSNP